MKISEVVSALESIAPPVLQEEYDNAGLLVGDFSTVCTGVLCTLDVTEAVIEEAKRKNCNLVLAHHPVIFRPLKRISNATDTGRVVIAAIQNNIALYAAHTNLDNVAGGVNSKIADLLGLKNRRVLVPKSGQLEKLYTFVPEAHLEKVRDALFAAGAGHIGNYSECSFIHNGTGTFKAGEGTKPFAGQVGERHSESEVKLEVILPVYARSRVLNALFRSHPYEEVAYDLIALSNEHPGVGSGLHGDMEPVSESEFLQRLAVFNPNLVRHTAPAGKLISKVAVCGGAGSFLIPAALKAGADSYITADLKYHEFFAAEGRMMLCDVGHYESEQFTIDLFLDILDRKFPNFAVLKSEVSTNPVHYFTGK
jgi:dinuclear metal center YbgI/SA1388 family protein